VLKGSEDLWNELIQKVTIKLGKNSELSVLNKNIFKKKKTKQNNKKRTEIVKVDSKFFC